MKKITMASLVAIGAIALSGCGGGGGSSETPTGATTVTGQFIDATVSGLKYECATSGLNGTTNDKGEYTCNDGDTVSFYIGKYKLGSASASSGIMTPYTLYPDNSDAAINVAQLLQTLDSDGDGVISIPVGYNALDTITTLPTAMDFDDVMAGVVGKNLVTAEVATASMNENIAQSAPTTDLKALLGGKTFYMAGVEGGGSSSSDVIPTTTAPSSKLSRNRTIRVDMLMDKWLDKVVFSADASSSTWTNIISTNDYDEKSGTSTHSVNGNKLVFDSEDENEYALYVGKTADYLILMEHGETGASCSTVAECTYSYGFKGETRLYFTETKAKAYYDSLTLDSLSGGGGSSTTSTDTNNTVSDVNPMVLAGKTIYGVGPVMIESTTFNASMTTATWKNEYGVGDDSQQLGNTGSLPIEVNGDNSIDFNGEDTSWIKTMDSTQIVFESVTGGTKTFYLDLEYAKSVYNNQ